jgi:hypothetical protein
MCARAILSFAYAVAALALAASASAQSIEDRAAEVVRSLEAPPPVETVIERRRIELDKPSVMPSTTPSRAPTTTSKQVPAMRTPPEFRERLERIFGRPGEIDQGDAVTLDPRRAPQVPPGIPSATRPTPGLVQAPSRGSRVQGSANAYPGGKVSGRP